MMSFQVMEAHFFKTEAILSWKRTLTSMVKAGPMKISALIIGPTPGTAPEVVLGLEMSLPFVQVLEEAAEVWWAGALLRCVAVDCCSWLL